jgi:SpoVK/Ycf46/Vps4 family AAA+-type ATPase
MLRKLIVTFVAFFMRKGADVLSKWVGEAERQLKILFEEAKNAQPSIIFFDEIDGMSARTAALRAKLISSVHDHQVLHR